MTDEEVGMEHRVSFEHLPSAGHQGGATVVCRIAVDKSLRSRFGMLVDQFGTPWMVNCEQSG